MRGYEGIREASLDVDGLTVNVAVVYGTANVRQMIERVKSGEKQYHFIEVMACRGGCVSGGGQPYGSNDEIRAKRAAGLYQDDKNSEIRVSHKNPDIITLYNEYLKEPCGEKSHHLLHTHYTERELYNYQ